MKQTSDLQELLKTAARLVEHGADGQTYVNQTNHSTEEPLLSDEDTAGRHALQDLRVILHTNLDTTYFDYIFNEPTEMEEVILQLEEVFRVFPKKVVSDEEMNHLISSI